VSIDSCWCPYCYFETSHGKITIYYSRYCTVAFSYVHKCELSYMCPGHKTASTPSEIILNRVYGIWLGIGEGANVLISVIMLCTGHQVVHSGCWSTCKPRGRVGQYRIKGWLCNNWTWRLHWRIWRTWLWQPVRVPYPVCCCTWSRNDGISWDDSNIYFIHCTSKSYLCFEIHLSYIMSTSMFVQSSHEDKRSTFREHFFI